MRQAPLVPFLIALLAISWLLLVAVMTGPVGAQTLYVDCSTLTPGPSNSPSPTLRSSLPPTTTRPTSTTVSLPSPTTTLTPFPSPLWYVTPVDWRDPTQEIAPIFQEATTFSAMMTQDRAYNASTAIVATSGAYWASRPTWTATGIPGAFYRVVAIQGVNVRSMATTSAGVVGRLNYGLDVWITNVSAGLVDGWRWGYVNTPGAMGWVALYNASVTLLQAK